MSKVCVLIQDHEEVMISAPWLRKRVRGIRLTKNAIFTLVLGWVRAQFCCKGEG